ncbi:DUF2784 domain-containing protein [Kaarinaea lacus]
MLAYTLANIILIVHFLFILFALLGGLFLLRYRWVAWLHVPAFIWAALISFAGWVCPLTPWEVALRKAAGEDGYAGGFIEQYITPVIYPEGYTREFAITAGITVLLVNLLIYGAVIYRTRIQRKS